MQMSLEPLALLVKKAQHRQNRMLEAALAPLGVSLVQWNALREVGRNPGLPLRALAALTFNSDQAFGMLAARLIDAGLAERQRGAGKTVLLTLTDRGKALLLAGYPAIDEASAACFAALPQQGRAELARLLAVILGEDPPPTQSPVRARVRQPETAG